jgi:phosphatidate cytidylyltransferase
MFLQRMITGSILLVISLLVIKNGGALLLFSMCLFAVLTLSELFGMAKKDKTLYPMFSFILITLIFLLSYFEPTKLFWNNVLTAGLTLGLVCFYIVEVFLKKIFLPKSNFGLFLRFIIFVSLTFPFIYLIRDMRFGFFYLLFVSVLVWSGDIFAYFGGRKFGKHKLAPALSPKKTIEGSVSGLLGTLLLAWVFIWILNLPFLIYSLGAVLISILGQLGDLHESLVKRTFQVKDSSNLLPGHGGMYDRVDSALLVMPMFYYFLLFFG